MKIQTVKPFAPLKLHIIAEDGQQGIFDLTPYLKYEVFVPLQNPQTFAQITGWMAKCLKPSVELRSTLIFECSVS